MGKDEQNELLSDKSQNSLDKEEKLKDTKDKDKTSKTDESSEHSVEKDKLDVRLKENRRKIVEVEQENDHLFMIIGRLTHEIINLKQNSEPSKPLELDLLTEILALKVCLQDCSKNLSEVLQTDAE